MQALGGIRLGGEFGFEALGYAFETTLTHIPQNSVLAREIAEESRLADFENVDDIIDPGLLVALFAEQPDGCLDNLLTKSRLLPLTKAWDLVDLRRRISLHWILVVPASSRYGDLNMSHSPNSLPIQGCRMC